MITHATLMDAKEKTRSYVKRTLGKDCIPLAIETYGCLHSHFNSFLITCAQNTIVRHQWSYLIPSMFISHYQQHLSIALQHAQTITIFQWVVAFGWGSSSLPHIIANALLSLVNLAYDSFLVLGLLGYY